MRPWLLTICRNVCLDRLRAGRRRPSVSIDAERVGELPSTAPVDDGLIDFRRALEQLTPEDREAFMLVDVLGYRSHEAAAILGIAAPSTLRSRLAHARRELAPSVLDAPSEMPAEIWGVYHRPPESAIVASFESATSTGTRDASIADLIANCERARTATSGDRGAPDLADFFDRLDTRIPAKLGVLAVIDERRSRVAGGAQHWLADHPRWRVRRAVSHACWLLEVESLLRAAGTGRHSAALAALDAPTPFLWTHAR